MPLDDDEHRMENGHVHLASKSGVVGKELFSGFHLVAMEGTYEAFLCT
jgi:hypothetical protein